MVEGSEDLVAWSDGRDGGGHGDVDGLFARIELGHQGVLVHGVQHWDIIFEADRAHKGIFRRVAREIGDDG